MDPQIETSVPYPDLEHITYDYNGRPIAEADCVQVPASEVRVGDVLVDMLRGGLVYEVDIAEPPDNQGLVRIGQRHCPCRSGDHVHFGALPAEYSMWILRRADQHGSAA